MSLDLPRITLAEAATAALCLVCAVMVEAVLGARRDWTAPGCAPGYVALSGLSPARTRIA